MVVCRSGFGHRESRFSLKFIARINRALSFHAEEDARAEEEMTGGVGGKEIVR